MSQMDFNISVAPLQGITDFRFRRCFQKHFDGVDRYYAPYIRLEHGGVIPKSRVKDTLPENNEGIPLVPQIMSNQAEEMIFMAEYLQSLGFSEMNWNLGCPYPMVTNKQLGSGLLPHPERIRSLLDLVLAKTTIEVSVKVRLGLIEAADLSSLIPVFNDFPVKEVIIHPRLGKQQYKELADREAFGRLYGQLKAQVGYNGDICSASDLQDLQHKFPDVYHWMIGRAIIANPFLAEEGKGILTSSEEKLIRFKKFHEDLTDEYLAVLSGPSHLITRMRGFWEYFSLSFSNPHKVFKRIKKATSLEKYQAAVQTVLKEDHWIA